MTNDQEVIPVLNIKNKNKAEQRQDAYETKAIVVFVFSSPRSR